MWKFLFVKVLTRNQVILDKLCFYSISCFQSQRSNLRTYKSYENLRKYETSQNEKMKKKKRMNKKKKRKIKKLFVENERYELNCSQKIVFTSTKEPLCLIILKDKEWSNPP